MKKFYYVILLFLVVGCQEVERESPVPVSDVAPGKISNVEVQNIPGGAVISYTLPDSKSLLYVLAEYSIREGVTLEKKSSYYKNSVTIEGFPNINEREVKLYAVSRGEKKSEPVTVKIKPLTPPVISVFRSLILRPTFGGLNVAFLNESEANVKLNVLTPDSLGDLMTADIFYTNWMSGDFSVRGYDSVPRKFGVFVRDRWNNYSDTVFANITPFFEKELDKAKFKAVHLPNDTYAPHRGFKSEEAAWDGLTVVVASAFHTQPGSGLPQWFTIDLGATARLSRFKIYHKRSANFTTAGTAYSAGDPKVFEIWGSNDPPLDGSWENWHLLGRFVNMPPSGSVPATMEDINFAVNEGTDYEFPAGNDGYRYIRFKTIETWGGVDYMYMGELTFWGSEE